MPLIFADGGAIWSAARYQKEMPPCRNPRLGGFHLAAANYQPRPAFGDGAQLLSLFLLDSLTIQAPLQIPDLLLDLLLSVLGGEKYVIRVRVLFLPFVFHLVKPC